MTKVEIQPNSEPQKKFLRNDKKNLAFISGIGAGKTVAGIMRTALNLFKWNEGERGYVVAPTHKMLNNVIIPEMKKWNLINEEFSWNRSQKKLHLPNDSVMIMDSADNKRKIERLRGPNISWFWMDEGARMPKKVWDIMIGRLRTGSYRNAYVTTTPKGFNWIYKEFIKKDKHYFLSDIPTNVNPELPSDYLERMEEYEGQFYQQEIQGQFVQFEGLVHPWFSEDHIVSDLPSSWDETIYGLDWGYRNPMAVVVLVRRGDEFFVVDELYDRRLTIDDLVPKLSSLEETWGNGKIFCDPSEPSNIEKLKREGFSAKKANNDVMPGISQVSSLRNQLSVSDRCQNTINEFRSYQYKDNDKEEPQKENDHAMDSLRYALYSNSKIKEAGVATISWTSNRNNNKRNKRFSY